MKQVYAGILEGATLSLYHGSVVAFGKLTEDKRGRFGNKANIRTSVLKSVVYDPSTDDTTLITLNSIYISTGNLLKDLTDDFSVESELDLRTLVQARNTRMKSETPQTIKEASLES